MSMVLGEIEVKVTADTSDLDAKMGQAGSTVESYASKVNSATSSTKDFTAASGVMATGAAGITAGLVDSVMAAGDFQATVNEIGAVSGATASELTQLSDMALQVGKDTAFSAQEGAQAISELSKAGVTVPDILNGAAMATANLAAAAGVDMPRAAEIMSNAMNMFKISGEDSARVADVLAAAANTSAASVDELATGFSQAGPSAAALGLSLEDTAAALALFADRGLSGSDAGTSLKTMLASLTPATKPAKEAFAELGLVTEESGNAFFDAQGNFVGMEAAADTLYDALKDLTDQQRAQYLETIFGSDASRAAELMFQAQRSAAEGTGRGYDDYRAAVEASGQASDVAEAKMAGMNGAIEALKGSIETAQIVIGTTFVGAIEFAADALSGIVDIFLNLPGPVQTAIAGVTAGAAAFLAVGSAVGFIIGPLGAFTAALVPMAAGILAIAAPLALVTAAIAAFAIAYKTNFLGFGDAVDSVVAKVTTFASQFGQIFDLFSNGSDAASGLTKRIEGFGKAVEFTTGLPVADFFSGIASALDEAGNHFASIQERITELMGAGFTPLQAAVRALREEFPAFSGAIAAAGTLIQNFVSTVQGIASGLGDALNALRNGDWGGVFAGLLAAGQAAVTGLLNHFSILGGALLQAFNAIDWAAIGATLYAGIQSVSTGLQTWFQEQSDKLADTLSGAWSAISAEVAPAWAIISAAISGAWANVQTTVSTAIETLKTNVGTAWTAIASAVAPAWAIVTAAISGAWANIQTTIGTALTTLQTNVGTFFSGLGPSITTAMGDFTTLLTTKGTELFTGLKTGLDQKWTEVQAWLGTVKDLMGTAVGDLTQTLLAKGSDLLAGLKSGIDQKWPEVDAWLAALPQDITDTVGDLAETLKAKGSDAITGLKAGIDEKWPEVDSWLAALPQDVVDTVGDLSQTLVDKGTDLLTGLKQGIDDTWPEVETWLGTVTDLASTAVGDLTESIKAHGTELITGLSTGAQDFWTGTVEPWLATLGDLASTAVGDLSQTLLDAGTSLIDGMRHGAQDLWNNQLGPWLQSLPGLIVSAVGDLSQTLVNAGAQVIGGLISGIESKVGDLKAKLGEVTSLIPLSKGPPKKDAMLLFENGQLIIEGLIEGIKSRIPDLDELLQAITERIQSRFDDTRPYEESGKKAGKGVVDGMNEATGDISDYEVGSAEWRQALQNKITAGMDKVGKKLGDDVNTGVKSKKADHKNAMGEFLDAGVDYGLNKARDAEDIGVMAANAMRDGLTSSQQTLVTTAGKIATQVVDEFGDRVQAMYDVGKNFGDGFVRGLESMADEAAAAANALGKTAEKELRKATESQSPSKAAHRVGEDVARGFAGGIASGEDMTAKAARQLWRKAWRELKDNVREFGFLGRDWAAEFWQGMLDAPDMTGPLAAWITEQMVDAAKGALAKIRAEIAGLAAQIDIARALVDAPSSIPEVPQPEPVDTTQRDLLQAQLDATKELTAAIEKAFTSAFDAAHKAHVAFVKGQISESEYQAKLQIAQNAYAQKQMNAAQVASLESQVKAAQAAIDAETAARQKAYEQAVKDRQAAVDAETAARKQALAQLEQAQRDAQMEMTKTVIDEANQRIAQYQKELQKAHDPKEKAELKAKIALEQERINVATKLAGAITAANTAASEFDLAKANAQIEFFSAQLSALEDVDVGGMLQGIADAITSAAEAMSQAADKIKHAFSGGGKNKGEKDKGGATQDASDPALSGGSMGGVTQEFDKGGKAARKFGDDVNAGMGVADMAIQKVLGTTLPKYISGMGEAGTKGGKALGDNASVAIEHGEANMSKTIVTSVEKGTVNGIKMGADRGKEIGVTITTNMETGARERTREVTKTVDGVVKDSTSAAVPTAEQGGKKVGDQFIYFAQQNITQGQRQVSTAAKGAMDKAGADALGAARTGGTKAGKELADFAAKGISQNERGVKTAGKTLMDRAGEEAKRDANRLGRNAGDDLGRGVAEGIRGRINDVRQAAKDLQDAANSGGGGGGGGGNGGGGGGGGHRRDAVIEAQQLGTRVGDAMGSGVANGLAAQTRSAQQAATNLVMATNDAARKAAQAHSPSKLFMRLGNDIGDGLVIGLHDRTGDAEDAARALVYAPRGLPGGDDLGPRGKRSGKADGGDTNIHIENLNLDNIRDAHQFVRDLEHMMETKMRMWGVSSGRG